jgi:hypothetical protein
MTARRQHFEIACDSQPVSVELDPNTWMLAKAQFDKR